MLGVPYPLTLLGSFSTMKLFATTCLLAMVCVASARLPAEFDAFSFGIPSNLQDTLALKRKGQDVEDQPAYVKILFRVPPSESDDFEDRLLKLYDADDTAEKFLIENPKTDNVYYSVYAEWDTKHEFLNDFIQSNMWDDFKEYVNDRNIKWELIMLENVSEEVEREQERMRASKGKNQLLTEGRTHIKCVYEVPPESNEEFIDAWNEFAMETIQEDGNLHMCLRNVVTDNTHFYGLGSWESLEDFEKHYQADHSQRLLKFHKQNDVHFFLEPLDIINEEELY